MAAVNFAFLHGGGQGSWVWDETIAALQAQSGGAARCLALDVPGCGTKRARDTGVIDLPAVAAELIADIEAAGMDDVVLVGHSQAGSTLPLMAERKPGLFRRIVYVTCQACPPGRNSIDFMGNCRHGESDTEVGWPVDPETTTLAERFRAMFCNDMTAAEGQAFVARLGEDMWPMSSYGHTDWRYDHLAGLPSTYVLCLRDQSLPPTWQERFAERLHTGRTVRIDAGHQVMNTRPQALAEVLLAEARC
jgi:pimeloyl-ACP methyl ester carboxylesterase